MRCRPGHSMNGPGQRHSESILVGSPPSPGNDEVRFAWRHLTKCCSRQGRCGRALLFDASWNTGRQAVMHDERNRLRHERLSASPFLPVGPEGGTYDVILMGTTGSWSGQTPRAITGGPQTPFGMVRIGHGIGWPTFVPDWDLTESGYEEDCPDHRCPPNPRCSGPAWPVPRLYTFVQWTRRLTAGIIAWYVQPSGRIPFKQTAIALPGKTSRPPT